MVRLGVDVNQNSFTTSAGVIFYYNGIPTVKDKAVLIKQSGNGIMFWELFQDVNGTNSLIKAANKSIGRTY